MSIVITETRGQSSSSFRSDRRFIITGSTSIADVRSAIIDQLTDDDELVFEGLNFYDITLDEVGFSAWEARVIYQLANFSGGDPLRSTSFDTTGGVIRIVRGLESVGNEGAPYSGDLIGINEDLKVDGIDIPQRAFDFEIRVSFTDEMTLAYTNLLASQTGTVNSALWNSYPRGSVLFRGVRGAQQPNGTWDLAFCFSHRPNPGTVYAAGYDEVLQVGPTQTGTAEGVEGWHVNWTFNQPHGFTFGDDKVVMPIPQSLYVTRVFEYSDFELLNAL